MQNQKSSRLEKIQEWLRSELSKDKVELNKEKLDFIKMIKNNSKEEILPKKEKLSLWKRISRVLIGR
jgi:hypothetical protein